MSQQVNKAGLPNKSLHSDGLQPRVNVALGQEIIMEYRCPWVCPRCPKTNDLTINVLQQFLDHVKQEARPCFKCRKLFLRTDELYYKC
jgi:hypothetical protein